MKPKFERFGGNFMDEAELISGLAKAYFYDTKQDQIVELSVDNRTSSNLVRRYDPRTLKEDKSASACVPSGVEQDALFRGLEIVTDDDGENIYAVDENGTKTRFVPSRADTVSMMCYYSSFLGNWDNIAEMAKARDVAAISRRYADKKLAISR